MSSYNLYDVLELKNNASIDQIKAAYRKLAMIYHPDKGGDVEKFRQISEAYQILSDPQLRKKYDQSNVRPEVDLIPPLKFFAQSFGQWLNQYPVMNMIFNDSCQQVLRELNSNHDNFLAQLIIRGLNPNASKPWRIERDLYADLADIYYGRSVPYQINLDNKMLQIADDYRIVNNKIPVTIPLTHDEITIDLDVHLEHHVTKAKYKRELKYIVNVKPSDKQGYYMFGNNLLVTGRCCASGERKVNIDLFGRHMELDIPKQSLSEESKSDLELQWVTQLFRIPEMGFKLADETERGSLYVLAPVAVWVEKSTLSELPTILAEQCDLRQIVNKFKLE